MLSAGFKRLLSGLAALSPWLIVLALAYAAAFISPQTTLRPLPQPLLENRDVFFAVTANGSGGHLYAGIGSTVLERDQFGSWQRQQLQPITNIQAAATHDNGTVALVGNQGALFIRQPGSTEWQFQQLPVNQIASKMLAVSASPDGFWVVGEMGTIIHYELATQQLNSVTLAQDINLNDVQVSSNGDIWIAAEFGTLLMSSDQGLSWSTQEIAAETLQALWVRGEQLVAVGNSGLVAVSNDGGQHWQSQQLGKDHLYAVAYHDNHYVIAGNGGSVFRSTDQQAQNWQALAVADQARGFISAIYSDREQLWFSGNRLSQLLPASTQLQVIGVAVTASIELSEEQG